MSVDMKTVKKALLPLMALVAGGIWMEMGLREFLEARRLRAEGHSVAGRVLHERVSYRYRGGIQYYLTVAFQAKNGPSITREVRVDYDTHREAAGTGAVNV